MIKETKETMEVGVFNLEQKVGEITLPVPYSGQVENLYTNQFIELKDGKLTLQTDPIRFMVKKELYNSIAVK